MPVLLSEGARVVPEVQLPEHREARQRVRASLEAREEIGKERDILETAARAEGPDVCRQHTLERRVGRKCKLGEGRHGPRIRLHAANRDSSAVQLRSAEMSSTALLLRLREVSEKATLSSPASPGPMALLETRIAARFGKLNCESPSNERNPFFRNNSVSTSPRCASPMQSKMHCSVNSNTTSSSPGSMGGLDMMKNPSVRNLGGSQ